MNSTTTGTDRIYYMDLARCVILITGVFFHAAFVFSNPGWMVVSPWKSEFLSGFVSFVREFRMEALFVVSGFFSAVLVTRKGSKGFVLNRMVRMGVPLVFCGLVFNSSVAFLQDQPSPPWSTPGYFSSGIWMLHLWNIGNLLAYEGCMFTALWLFPTFHQYLSRIRLPVPAVLLAYLAGTLSFYWIWFRLPVVPGVSILFQTDSLALFIPAYLLGYTVHQNKDLRSSLFDWRLTLPLAFGIMLLGKAAIHYVPSLEGSRSIRFLGTFEHLCWTLLIFSLVRRFETRNIWVRRLSIASYSIYILHLPLQVLLFRMLPAARIGYGAFLFLSIVPICAIWLFHVQVIERWKWAGFLFNGKIYDAKTRSF